MTKEALIRTMIDKLLDLLKKGVRGYISRLISAFKYSLEIALATGINAAIMIPIAFVAQFAIKYMGFDVGVPSDIPDIDPSILGEGILPLVALSLSIGIMEETLCRYLIQDCLFERFIKMPAWVSLAVASIFFGLLHLANPGTIAARMPQALGAIGAGLWFGYIYRKRGLHFAIMTHAFYDFVVIYLSFL